MRYLVRMAVVLLIPFALAGCLATASEGPNPVSQATASAQFKQFCKALPLGMAAFNAVKTRTKVSATVVNNANAAYAIGRDVCANPPQDTYQALATITDAYDRVIAAQEATTPG